MAALWHGCPVDALWSGSPVDALWRGCPVDALRLPGTILHHLTVDRRGIIHKFRLPMIWSIFGKNTNRSSHGRYSIGLLDIFSSVLTESRPVRAHLDPHFSKKYMFWTFARCTVLWFIPVRCTVLHSNKVYRESYPQGVLVIYSNRVDCDS